jgi:hypothetical protein
MADSLSPSPTVDHCILGLSGLVLTVMLRKFLEIPPAVIPAPLKLSFIRARKLRKEAGKLPIFTMQSMYLSRALIYRLIVLSQDMTPDSGVTGDELKECLKLRR